MLWLRRKTCLTKDVASPDCCFLLSPLRISHMARNWQSRLHHENHQPTVPTEEMKAIKLTVFIRMTKFAKTYGARKRRDLASLLQQRVMGHLCIGGTA